MVLAADFPDARLPFWPHGGVPFDTLAKSIADWLDSPALTALVVDFGGRPPTGDLGARLAALEVFSSVWDGRAGGERLTAVYPDFSVERQELVEAAARALGLTNRERPAATHYDHVLVLGGGLITARARALFAASLLGTGVVTAATIAALGSMREVSVDPLVTEGDVMHRGLTEAFPPAGAVEERAGATPDGNEWWVRTYACGTWSASTIAAPPTRPGMRANTADTLLGWAGLVTRPKPDESVLVVTTDLFVPFQHADAVSVLGLPYRCGIDTVGFSTRTFPGWPKAPSSTGALLQELRSAIMSLHRLHQRAG